MPTITYTQSCVIVNHQQAKDTIVIRWLGAGIMFIDQYRHLLAASH